MKLWRERDKNEIMTTKHQKNHEVIYATKAGGLLGETWNVEPSPDEANYPDLIVTIGLVKFGLEVREIYLDEPMEDSTKLKIKKRPGSGSKKREAKNRENIKKLADDYYKANCLSIKVDFLGDISHPDQLLKAIIDEAPQLSEFEQKRIVPYNGCVIYIRKLPEQLGKYKRWNYVSDKVGWVSSIDKNIIDMAIVKKANNLPKYTKKISDIRLLLVSDRIYNSGKAHLMNKITFDARGFNSIYYLSYPDEVWQLTIK